MKLTDDLTVRVGEAANCLRKQRAIKAVKCWKDGGKGLAHIPKGAITKVFVRGKSRLVSLKGRRRKGVAN